MHLNRLTFHAIWSVVPMSCKGINNCICRCLSNLTTFILRHLAQPFPFSLIIIPAAKSQQFTSNNAKCRATKGEKTVGKQTRGRLNRCGLFGAWEKAQSSGVCVSLAADELGVCVFVLAANIRNKSVSVPCISSRPQLLLVFKLDAGVCGCLCGTVMCLLCT